MIAILKYEREDGDDNNYMCTTNPRKELFCIPGHFPVDPLGQDQRVLRRVEPVVCCPSEVA